MNDKPYYGIICSEKAFDRKTHRTSLIGGNNPLHEWQALGSNLSPETGYFGFFFKKKEYLCNI